MKGCARGALFVAARPGLGSGSSLRHHRRKSRRRRGPDLELAPAAPAAPFARATGRATVPPPPGPRPALRVPDRVVVLHRPPRRGRRAALRLPAHVLPPRASRRAAAARPGLRTNQVYFAHFAITDVAGRRHEFCRALEPRSRGPRGRHGRAVRGLARGLAGRRRERRRQLGAPSRARPATGASTSQLGRDEAARRSTAIAGCRRRAREPGNASYYVGYTRMTATGPTCPQEGRPWPCTARRGSTTSGARARSVEAPWAGTG